MADLTAPTEQPRTVYVMPTIPVLVFPAPTKPWSVNENLHWATRAKRVRAWRTAGRVEAWAAGVTEQGPSRVTVSLPFARKARRDAHNYVPAVKAIIDGLVDAGIWPDDNTDWVTVSEPVLVYGTDMVTVRIEPWEGH